MHIYYIKIMFLWFCDLVSLFVIKHITFCNDKFKQNLESESLNYITQRTRINKFYKVFEHV